jgi:hypothetical protein
LGASGACGKKFFFDSFFFQEKRMAAMLNNFGEERLWNP